MYLIQTCSGNKLSFNIKGAMKNNNWIEAKETNLNGKNEFVKPEERNENNFYGRTYNEAVPFGAANFAAYQSILDQRNELLGSVKSSNQN